MIIYGDKGGYKTATNTEKVSSVVSVAGAYHIYQCGFVCEGQSVHCLSARSFIRAYRGTDHDVGSKRPQPYYTQTYKELSFSSLMGFVLTLCDTCVPLGVFRSDRNS